MRYEFIATHSIHESGSKYYQVIMIREEGNSKGVVVTHWGKTHPGAPSEPKHHGQSKVELRHAGVISEYNGAINNKKKRGYDVWDFRKQIYGANELECRALINGWFRTPDAEAITAHLFPVVSKHIAVIDELDDLDPFVEEEVLSTPLITEATKENWGSW